MRLPSLAVASLALVSNVQAQYFSDGWKPGQPVRKAGTGYTIQPSPTHAAGVPEQTASAQKSPFDLSTYLEMGPIKSLFSRAGVNITERLEAARLQQDELWDSRIPLITDDNYKDLIEEEEFVSLEEEKDRLWFIVISVTSAQREGISKFVDEQFDLAFNLTQEAGDLSHVRWGRIDYMNVTAITTKWAVWRAPYLVVLKDRGQTLRFYRPGTIRLQGEILREFLKQDAWETTAPWRSVFAPGGSREFILEYLALVLTKVYNVAVMVPRWLLLVITGSIASVLVNLLHNSNSIFNFFRSKKPAPKLKSTVQGAKVPSSTEPVPTAEVVTVASGSKTSKSGASKRKVTKK